jgi:hypothetical protein
MGGWGRGPVVAEFVWMTWRGNILLLLGLELDTFVRSAPTEAPADRMTEIINCKGCGEKRHEMLELRKPTTSQSESLRWDPLNIEAQASHFSPEISDDGSIHK